MNICQLTNASPSELDPDECDVFAAAAALADAGHEVHLLSPAWPPPPVLAQGFQRQVFGDALASSAPDIVHAHEPFLAGEHALRLAAETGAPLVFTADLRYDSPLALPGPEAAALRSFVEKLGVCFANRCDAVIAPSPALAVRLFELGVTRPIHVAPDPRARSALPAHAVRIAEIYEETRLRRGSRGPAPCVRSDRLHQELSLAWERARPAAPGLARGGPRFARADAALPC